MPNKLKTLEYVPRSKYLSCPDSQKNCIDLSDEDFSQVLREFDNGYSQIENSDCRLYLPETGGAIKVPFSETSFFLIHSTEIDLENLAKWNLLTFHKDKVKPLNSEKPKKNVVNLVVKV